MEQQEQQRVDQQLRQNWQQIRYQILDDFAQVSAADLDSARDFNDLVQRIADITHDSDRFVENRLVELAGTPIQEKTEQTEPGHPFGTNRQE